MYISVNKTTVARRPVKYAALASGTISHVWSEEEEVEQAKLSRRKVRIVAKSELVATRKSPK